MVEIKKINKFDQKHLTTKDAFIQIKQIDEDGTIEGYGSISTNTDNYNDRVMPGAFKKTLEDNKKARRKLPILWQHKQDEPIGYWFDSKEDDNGLYMRGQLDFNVQRAREAYSLLSNQAINGLSIGFVPVRYEIDPKSGVRELYEVKLMEVSVVTFPANEMAQVTSVKNDYIETMEQLDEINQAKVLGYAQALFKSADTASLGANEPTSSETVNIQLMEENKEEEMKVANISIEVPYEDAEEVKNFARELKEKLSSEEGHSDSQADADTVEPQTEEYKEFLSYMEEKLNNLSKHSTSQEVKAAPEDGILMRTSMGSEAQHRHNYRMGDTQTELAVGSDGTEHRHVISYDSAGEPVIEEAEGHTHPAGFPVGPAYRGMKPYEEDL